MPDPAQTAVFPPDAPAPVTLVLLCRDLERTTPGLKLAEVAPGLARRWADVQVRLAEGLCHRLGMLPDAVRQARAQRLVLGLCSGHALAPEAQAQVRKAGLDPLGAQVVDLRSACGGATVTPGAGERLGVILAAAIARAMAFPGSGPDNVKAKLVSLRQTMSRRALFTLPPVTYEAVPTIARDHCTAAEGCALCVDACPYEALGREGGALRVDRDRCRSCGVCVAVCPQRAVAFPGWSAAELEAQVAALLDTEADPPARALLFLCKEAPLPAGAWLPVRVPCTAMVPVAAMLQPLAGGATAVALAPCRARCPADRDAGVRGRVDYCQHLLRLLGDAPERVQVLDAENSGVPPVAAGIPAGGLPAPRAPALLFGRGAAADAVAALAARSAVQGCVLEHPFSPVGTVQIDAQVCSGCCSCAVGCPTGALARQREGDEVTLTLDARWCSACGQCVTVCPEAEAGALRVDRVTDVARLRQGRVTISQEREARCEACGAPIAPLRTLNRIAALLGSEDASLASWIGRYCLSCRGSR
ncbi:MAG: 4Fe-4S binding protein [Chloroflexi bacterium]|nr:4Fe-4S binding protein [Chloroflexota bacterium]